MIDTRYTQANEIVKYQFLKELEHSGINGNDPKSEDTVWQYEKAIHEFEVAINFKDFKKYDSEFALEFKSYLEHKKNQRTGKNISKSFYVNYLKYNKEFFEWLRTENKEYSKITQKDINFLKTNKNDKNTALATPYQPSHPINIILAVIRNMPATTLIEIRNKAMISLCLLTTPRISALKTARISSIKHFVEYEAWAFDQHPRLVDTKYKRHITSFFIGQSQDIIDNVLNWWNLLKEKGFKSDDYLFPRIDSSFDSKGQPICELSNKIMGSSSWIGRSIFKKAFQNNDVEFYRVHSFRHSIERAMEKEPYATQLLIALAENDGHKNQMATLISSYGGNYMIERSKLMKGFKLE
jgi:integrase/recombinase XerD